MSPVSHAEAMQVGISFRCRTTGATRMKVFMPFTSKEQGSDNAFNQSAVRFAHFLLEDYLQNDKKSADDITPDSHFHPMAEGKFLSALSSAHHHGLIAEQAFSQNLLASIAILQDHNLAENDTHALFGLGFQWLDRPPTEAFLITTTVCAWGLIDAYEASPLPQVKALLDKTLSGLLHWIDHKTVLLADGKTFPAYSASVKIPIYNPAAHCYGVIKRALHLGLITDQATQKQAETRLEEIFTIVENARAHGIGWWYSQERPVSDLVHINYIGSAYLQKFSPADAEEIILPITGHYYMDGFLYERTRIINKFETIKLGRGSFTNCAIRKSGDTWFAVDPFKARLWAIGEYLLTAAFFAGNGKHAWHWRNQINAIVATLTRYPGEGFAKETTFARHTMHLAHGLLACLPYIESAVDLGATQKLFEK